MAENKMNPEVVLISLAVLLALSLATAILIRKWIKKQKVDNADKILSKLPTSASVIDATIKAGFHENKKNFYTVYDPIHFYLNETGKQILATLEKELYATFYTTDESILAGLGLLKTKSDFAQIQSWFNATVSAYKDKQDLLVKMAQEMTKENFAKALHLIDNLKLTV